MASKKAAQKMQDELYEVIKLNLNSHTSGVVLDILNERDDLVENVVPQLKKEIHQLNVVVNQLRGREEAVAEREQKLEEMADSLERSSNEQDKRSDVLDSKAALITKRENAQEVFEANLRAKEAEKRSEDMLKLMAVAMNSYQIKSPTIGQREIED